ncbi:OmpA family protein [Nocardia bovistercoris]|uniref:OmpA family protein n=1 Tax=Nocardia bovistercoris TaxID=2785916 RepID=A0A931IE06_9NOCA|nr:OmpA family protein [Nocardia bovistercoris]MBH0779937.1 OmpA family protein [Nocardia bovistercoris]
MPHSHKSQNSLRSFCCPLRPNIPSSLVLILVFILLVIGLVTGCGSSAPSSTVRPITLVATATSAEPRTVLPESMVDELTSMAKRSKRKGGATVRAITAASGEASAIDLTPLRPNGQVQHATADAERQIRAAIDKLGVTLGETASTTPGLSVLPLLDRAAQIPDAEIHVLSSGISTEAPMDYRVIGWNTNPASVIDSIARQGQIPNLAGRHVTFHGLGVAGGSQPSLPPFARTIIERIWVGICERAEAASCTIGHDAPTAAAPVATMPVPVVPVPEVITENGCAVWLNLSDAVLHFAGGSAALPASADDALRPIVEATSRCLVQAIDITGHIADTGDGDDHNDLAGRRARAVADRLLALGLPPALLGTVSGHGAHEPVVPNFTGGIFDEDKATANRRVEVIFHQSGR